MVPCGGILAGFVVYAFIRQKISNINSLSPSLERVDASSDICPVNQFHLYQLSVASAVREMLLMNEQRKSSGHRSFLQLLISQY